MTKRAFQIFEDDFDGAVADIPTTADPATPWMAVKTAAAGSPVLTKGTSVLTATLAATSEVEVLNPYFGDALQFDIDDVQRIEFLMRTNGTAFTSGSILCFGLASARNSTADNVAANAWFRMEGASSTTLVYAETDDGVRDVDDISTGVTLTNSFKEFVIDFTGGKSNVKFYIDGQRVCSTQTFDMSGYSAGLQPYIQLQKAANTNVNGIVCDYVKVIAKRA